MAGTFAVAMLIATAALAGTLPKGNGKPTLLFGTYGFNFNGGESDDATFRASGSGSITFDGGGNVTGGIIHCNNLGREVDSTILGGSYSVNRDGTGYVTVDVSSSEKICGEDKGLDLTVSVVSGGTKFLFASDGSDNFYGTGKAIPFAGEADRL